MMANRPPTSSQRPVWLDDKTKSVMDRSIAREQSLSRLLMTNRPPTSSQRPVWLDDKTKSVMDRSIAREQSLSRLLMTYIITGLIFMLLPGTFLGVWNLIKISSREEIGRASCRERV